MNNNKIEVPEYVSEWFEKNKGKLDSNISSLIRNAEALKDVSSKAKIYDWVLNERNHPIETLIRMKIFGYVIEKPKFMVVLEDKESPAIYASWEKDPIAFSISYEYNSIHATITDDKEYAIAIAKITGGKIIEVDQ